MRIVKLTEDSRKNILEDLLKRSPNNYDSYAGSVNEILANVKENTDINESNILVTKEEIQEAYDNLENKELVDIIKKSLHNIKVYHEKQKQYSWFDSKEDGSLLGQKVTPIAKVGVYVPGGKAAYPSSVFFPERRMLMWFSPSHLIRLVKRESIFRISAGKTPSSSLNSKAVCFAGFEKYPQE